jgi:hypothetical protein
MAARLFLWHCTLANMTGSLLVGHHVCWSAGRCFRPCVAPHQSCLSFNVTSAINTHLFLFLSALRYLETTHRPSNSIGTLRTRTERPTVPVPSVYTQTVPQYCTFSLHTDGSTILYLQSTHRRFHSTCTFNLHTDGSTVPVPSVYIQTVPQYLYLQSTHRRFHNTCTFNLHTDGSTILYLQSTHRRFHNTCTFNLHRDGSTILYLQSTHRRSHSIGSALWRSRCFCAQSNISDYVTISCSVFV